MKTSMLVNVNVSCPGSMQKFFVVLPVPDKTAPVSSMLSSLKRHVEACLNDPSHNFPEAAQLKLCSYTRLYFQGRELGRLDRARLLDYYLPTTNSLATGFIAYMTADHPTEPQCYLGLFLKDLEGNTIPLHGVDSSDTVMHLKEILQQHIGMPPDEQCLIFAGKELMDNRTVADYNIGRGSTLHMVLRLRGGASPAVDFSDVSNNAALSNMEWSSCAPDWRIAQPGLCIEGYCRNPACKASGKLVIHKARFALFDLILDSAGGSSKCPCCSSAITPVTAAFNKCEWKYIGIKLAPGKDPESVQCEWKQAGDRYERFSDGPDNQVKWSRLLLIARAAKSVCESDHVECSICCDAALYPSSAEAMATPCRHYFHRGCLKPWLVLGKTGCPMCRKDISCMRTTLM